MIQRRCGRKPKGRACEAYPFNGELKEVDAAAIKSLSGGGKSHMTPTYKRTKWNGDAQSSPAKT